MTQPVPGVWYDGDHRLGVKEVGGLVRVCSFCGKTADQVEHIVAGETAAICNECVALCQQIIHAERERSVHPGEALPPHGSAPRGTPWWRRLFRLWRSVPAAATPGWGGEAGVGAR